MMVKIFEFVATLFIVTIPELLWPMISDAFISKENAYVAA